MGHIWVGTTNGLDRLDLNNGRVRHYDTGSGLANNAVVSTRLDGAGDLWIATAGGVSRLRPRLDPPGVAPPVLLTEVRAAGRQLTLPERGARELSGLTFPSSLHNVDVAFAAVELRPGHGLAYQHRMGAVAWSSLSHERQIHLAGLASGSYRFEVRAVLPDGTTGEPATLTFKIAAPVWRRWWFQTGVMLILAGAAYSVHRRRLARFAELYQVRARIAADLHDELGLSLSRVAMLAEVARPALQPGSRGADAVGEIATSARDLIDATSDMAWALDPSKDDLLSLFARLRRWGSDICEGAGVEWDCTVPDGLERVTLGAERRRHLLLILKEALHNSIRHGKPSFLGLTVDFADGLLRATVTDDGRGFNFEDFADSADLGHGLAGMQRRAEELKGTLTVRSRLGPATFSMRP